jgi:hypothetical protein
MRKPVVNEGQDHRFHGCLFFQDDENHCLVPSGCNSGTAALEKGGTDRYSTYIA